VICQVSNRIDGDYMVDKSREVSMRRDSGVNCYFQVYSDT
jgi:hypothetical protein